MSNETNVEFAGANLHRLGASLGDDSKPVARLLPELDCHTVPNVESLLLEAPIEDAVPSADELFRGVSADDPVERLERVDAALSAAISENEPALRL